MASRFAGAQADAFVSRVLALLDAGLDELLESPRYTRELVKLFLTSSGDMLKLRRNIDARSVDMMAALVQAAQDDGQLRGIIDPQALARHMYGHYVATILAWAHRDIDSEGLRASTHVGACLILLGVANGATKAELEHIIVATQSTAWRRQSA